MRLTIVGAAGSFPGPDTPCSSYLVEHDGYRLVLDLGNGALGELQRYTNLREVDAVVLSHLHPDHCVDLTGYAIVRRYDPLGRHPKLPVYGPAGTAGRLAAAFDPFSRDDLRDVFAFTKLEAGTRELGPFTLTLTRVNHSLETYAVRVEANRRSLTYSGDTGPDPALVDLARGSDVLLCEATFHHGDPAPPNLHLTGTQAGEHARRADVARLLVTHVPPWGDRARQERDARAAFGGPTELAVIGATYEI